MRNHEDLPYIKHIIDAINDIEDSIKSLSKEQFMRSKDVRDANVRRLEVIGEAVKNISIPIKEKYKEIAWTKIAGIRDKVIHHYFGVDLNIIWDVVKKDIPHLKENMLKIKEALESEEKAKIKSNKSHIP